VKKPSRFSSHPLQIHLPFLLCALLLISCTKSSDATPSQRASPSGLIPTRSVLTSTSTESSTEDIYLSQYCPLSFIVPEDWSVTEVDAGEPGSHSMSAPTVVLTKGEYELAVICYVLAKDSAISPGGRAAGELISMQDVPFLDGSASGQAIVWEGDTVAVLYTYRSEKLTIFVDIGPNPYADNTVPYEEFDIAEDVILEVVQMLESTFLTEDITNLEPIPTPDDPLAILPMDDFFHSQVDDIDLPNACAPTAGFIVLDYLKRETTLDEVARLLRKVEPEQGGFDPACERNVVCTSPMILAQRLSSEYHLTITTRQGWTLDSIYDALRSGHPVIADILWRADIQGLGHFVVIFGVDRDEKLVYYHDPFEGGSMVATWEVFSERWAGPVDVGDPTFLQGFRYWGMEVYSEEWEIEMSP
jgi:uncharacterized protein YvpB